MTWQFAGRMFGIVLIAGVMTLNRAGAENRGDTVARLLKEPIIGDALSLAEVQRYCESRIPLPPQVESATEWTRLAEHWRKDVLDQIVFRGHAARWRKAPCNVQWLETIEGGPGYHIRKLRYEALPGMWIPALLYTPDSLTDRVPAILNVNGHTSLGKQYPDKQLRCINQVKRGMLALNVEWPGMGQLNGPGFSHARMNQLDLCGASGLAPYFLAMQRGLDVLAGHEDADPQRLAVTGLSGGGWQTIFLSALDTRVALCNPVAGYSSFRTRVFHLKDLGDSEQTPNDLATLVDYTHLTAMLAPRPALLTFNSKDNCCFESGYALPPLVDAARPVYQMFGADAHFRTHINDDPGTHNFKRDNRQALYALLNDFFYDGRLKRGNQEIESQEEVKTAEQLHIDLPEPNQDFHSLAVKLSGSLPKSSNLPTALAGALKWQQARRQVLRTIVRADQYPMTAMVAGTQNEDALQTRFWRLQCGGDWTVPAVEFATGSPDKVALVVADGGRSSTSSTVDRLLSDGYRVVALDCFYLGESRIAERDYLYALLVAGVGRRPLGIQAGQLGSISRWATRQFNQRSVTLVADGPRTSVVALVAASLEPRALGEIRLRGSFGTLKQIIEKDLTVRDAPELFCFGLLEGFDIVQLAALVAPRPLHVVSASARARLELAQLSSWYGLWGKPFEPLD